MGMMPVQLMPWMEMLLVLWTAMQALQKYQMISAGRSCSVENGVLVTEDERHWIGREVVAAPAGGGL
jgi:hypothetical protein